MIHPSYSELMAVVNSEVEEGEQPLVQSRYSIVKATAARAKQIIDARSIQEKIDKNMDKEKSGEEGLKKDEERKLKMGTSMIPNSDNMKPLSIAVEELYEGKVKIVGNDEVDDEEEDLM
jgi:DNA-directed RNA polymerase subunit omega